MWSRRLSFGSRLMISDGKEARGLVRDSLRVMLLMSGSLVEVTCTSILITVSLITVITGYKKKMTAGLSPQTVTEESAQHIVTQEPTSQAPVVRSKVKATESVTTATAAEQQEVRVGRKLLPPIPDSETEAEMTASITNKQGTTGSGYGQLHLEYILMSEFNSLHKHKLPGVYVIPSALTPLIWNCVIFVRQGLYQEAVFRFNLNIPENYPNCDCPRVFFEHPVFHPLVDTKTGELDVKREFKKWKRNVNYLWQVLMYVRRIFFKIDTKCPLNQEAADLYEHNMEQFKHSIVENIRSSKDLIYNPVESNDTHAIKFSPWDSYVHDEARSTMLTRKKNKSDFETEPHKKNGLSWMAPGTTQIFSQEDTSTS